MAYDYTGGGTNTGLRQPLDVATPQYSWLSLPPPITSGLEAVRGGEEYQRIDTPMAAKTAADNPQLAAQIDALPIPDKIKQYIYYQPPEVWQSPDYTKAVNFAVQKVIQGEAGGGVAGEGGSFADWGEFLNPGSVSGGLRAAVEAKRPVSDLFQPVQNVGGGNAAMGALALYTGGLSLLGEGAFGGAAGYGAGDVAAAGAGGLGGGGAAEAGSLLGAEGGTAVGGAAGVGGTPPYYTGADAEAIGSGISPETGEAMNLGQEQLAGPGFEGGVGGATGEVGASGVGGAVGAGGVGGATQLSGPATTAGAVGTGSALSRIIDGTATTDDWTKFLGGLGATGLGIVGANQQANASQALADKLFGAGQSSRDRFEASMTPGFDPTSIPGYQGAVDTSSEAILRKLSATQGNPFGSPGGLIEANKAIISGTALPAVQAYQNQNAAAGGFGSFAAGAPGAGANAVGAQGGIFNAIGSGLSNLTNPPPDYSNFLKYLNRGIA